MLKVKPGDLIQPTPRVLRVIEQDPWTHCWRCYAVADNPVELTWEGISEDQLDDDLWQIVPKGGD